MSKTAPKSKGTQLSTSETKCTVANPQSTKSKSQAPKKASSTKSADPRLTIKQKHFIKKITDIEDPNTYGNATVSSIVGINRSNRPLVLGVNINSYNKYKYYRFIKNLFQ